MSITNYVVFKKTKQNVHADITTHVFASGGNVDLLQEELRNDYKFLSINLNFNLEVPPDFISS